MQKVQILVFSNDLWRNITNNIYFKRKESATLDKTFFISNLGVRDLANALLASEHPVHLLLHLNLTRHLSWTKFLHSFFKKIKLWFWKVIISNNWLMYFNFIKLLSRNLKSIRISHRYRLRMHIFIINYLYIWVLFILTILLLKLRHILIQLIKSVICDI